MNIQEIVNRIKEIALNHKEIKSVHVGNTWDQAASKSSDIYPSVWIELPILVSYGTTNQKTYTFSIDVLALPKQDDVDSELSIISQCETIIDQLTQVFKLKIAGIGIGRLTGLTVKNINADIACGVRIDIDVLTNKECQPLDYFKEEMDKI